MKFFRRVQINLLTFFPLYKLWSFFTPSWVKTLFIDFYLVYPSSHFFFWKTSNYADGYWFLYSNKKSTYEAVIQTNKKL